MIIERCQYVIGNARVKLIRQARFANRRFNLPVFVITPRDERTRDMDVGELWIKSLRQPQLFFGASYQVWYLPCSLLSRHKQIRAGHEPGA